MIRVGVDVGGTFTDVVALDEETGHTSWFKTLTDHGRPAEGVLKAVGESKAQPNEISQVKVGTTLALNAMLTRSGARTGLITTEGFRDVLEIRRTHRKTLFDLNESIPDPLVPRDLRVEVPERVDRSGRPVMPLDEEAVRAAWRFLRERGVDSLAIVFLFSFENPEHERRAREIVEGEGGAEVICISSDVLPAYREYERTSTTVAAAYVAPAVSTYLGELAGRLKGDGFSEGRLSVLTNSGGAMAAEVAGRAPIPTLLSGPAGGVAGLRWVAAQVNEENVLTFDMGGTSTDVSGVVGGIPDERLDMEIAGQAITFPAYDIQTIGAGGGSIARVAEDGRLVVGPESAGSEPGPACYGRGGVEPTVTDANLVLGRYSPEMELGGYLGLDLELATAAVERVSGPMGLSVVEAAAGIIRIVNSHMVNALRTISVERGRDARDFVLGAFGGAGPTHAAELAAALSITRVVVPPFPGCASAFGAVISRPRRDQLKTVAREMAGLDPVELGDVIAELSRKGRAALAEEGFEADGVELETWLDVRYRGQAYDLSVRHAAAEASEASMNTARESFHALHQQLYGHAFSDVPVDLVNVRVIARGILPEPAMTWSYGGDVEVEAEGMREVYYEHAGGQVEARVLDRRTIEPGASIPGPAVIHQSDSTVLVPPDSTLTAHPSGSLIIERGSGRG